MSESVVVTYSVTAVSLPGLRDSDGDYIEAAPPLTLYAAKVMCDGVLAVANLFADEATAEAFATQIRKRMCEDTPSHLRYIGLTPPRRPPHRSGSS